MTKRSASQKFNVRLRDENGKIFNGTLTLNGQLEEFIKYNALLNGLAEPNDINDISDDVLIPPRTNLTPSDGSPHVFIDGTTDDMATDTEYNSAGASSFVIAVILLYGFSIVFMIASHMFSKKQRIQEESDKTINQYLDQTATLRRQSRQESFDRLKRSLIPVIARSPIGRDMMAKRVKYIPYLLQYIPVSAISSSKVPTYRERLSRRISIISEERLDTIPERGETVNNLLLSSTVIEHHPEIHVDAVSDQTEITHPDEQNPQTIDLRTSDVHLDAELPTTSDSVIIAMPSSSEFCSSNSVSIEEDRLDSPLDQDTQVVDDGLHSGENDKIPSMGTDHDMQGSTNCITYTF